MPQIMLLEENHMPIHAPKVLETQVADEPARSLIKSHLLKLSGSGSALDGVIIERVLNQPNLGVESAPPDSPQHVLVFHCGNSARLEWRMDGRRKQAVFSESEAIINPVGLFTAPRWNAQTERLMVALCPATLNRVSEELGSNGGVELEPRYPCRDELLTQLARSLMTEFEQ